MDDIPAGLLNELVELLCPLKKMRMDLCSDNHCTFNMVFLTYLKVKKLMIFKPNDSKTICDLKLRFLKYLNIKFSLSEHHIIATFLSPQFRSTPRNHCEQDLLRNGMKLLNSYLEEVIESDAESDCNENNHPTNINSSSSLFDEYLENPSSSNKVFDEFTDYQDLDLTADEIKMDPFEFWMAKKSRYPKLSRVAFWILACPATSSSSERSFSKLGKMITSLKNRLDPKTVKKLSFISSNKDLL